jgi:hypothetical protein
MSHVSSTPVALDALPGPIDPDALEHTLVRSRTVAHLVTTGLPALSLVTMLVAGLPLFASLMAACFLFTTGLTCLRALAAFTAKTLQLLVTARLVIVLVLGALLLCAYGSAWMAIVSAVLLWLVTDRLLGRRALTDLRRAIRGRA